MDKLYKLQAMNREENINKKHRKLWRYAIGAVLVIVIASMSGCPVFYISSSVDGRVVNEKTGEPIPNVHIVGIWELEGGLIEHAYVGPLHLEETITDEQGRYHLEGFWFRLVWPMFFSYLDDSDPIIYLFAEGYQPRGRSGNAYAWKQSSGFYRRSFLNGKDVPLKPISEWPLSGASEWGMTVEFMKTELNRCDLTKIPETVAYLRKIESIFGQSGRKYIFVYESEYEDCR